MTSHTGNSSRERKPSVSGSSNELDSSGDEDEKNQTSTSNVSSSDITDLSGCMPSVDVEGDESPLTVTKQARRGAALKQSAGTSCWHNSGDKDNTHTVTYQHTETLVRRPLHRRDATRTKDSYIQYTSQCTVISERRNDRGMSWNMHLVVALALILVGCLVSLVLTLYQPAVLKLDTTHAKSHITPEMFSQAFNSIRESFRVQTSGFWGIIRAAIKPIVFHENPDQPAVFVLVVPSDTHETAACFIRLFSNTITTLLRAKLPVEFFTDTVSSLPPDRVKRLLDDQLRNGLTSGSQIAIIHHLEQLHGESAMMLHAYCDNENAPFRRAIFILTLFVDKTSLEVTETEAFVEEQLRALWGDTLGTNRFYPLITRIAHSIAFIQPDVLAQISC